MAEYYPLLAKAVGSLPNSTLESRRVVYERARKALIGQLRTLHPPVPEEDIDRESVALDQAVERLEAELAAGGTPTPAVAAAAPATPPRPAPPPLVPRPRPASVLPEAPPAEPGRAADAPAAPLLRTRLPTPRRPGSQPPAPEAAGSPDAPPAESGIASPSSPALPSPAAPEDLDAPGAGRPAVDLGGPPRVRGEVQRPIAPQPQGSGAPKRRLWIMFAGIGLVVVLVAGAAFKLRQSRETVTRRPIAEKTVPADSGKIAERVGGDGGESQPASGSSTSATPAVPTTAAPASGSAAPSNPEVPVAYRAALLVEAPSEANKVKTFLGTVTWKLINVGNGPSEAVGTAVEADVDLPDDKMKATITFEKNTDASLPASHTVRVRFAMQPGSFTGDVQQISVPQLRQEDSPGGDALAGVTVPVLQNSFLIGLSPGTAEAINLKQLKEQQWIDIPMLLASGKIAKLTFEKGDAGTRDLNEAMVSWSKP